MKLHEGHIALRSVRLHGIIFIKIERNDIFKTKSFLFMHSYKFFIDLDRRISCRKTQQYIFSLCCFFFNGLRNNLSNMNGTFPGVLPNRCFNLFYVPELIFDDTHYLGRLRFLKFLTKINILPLIGTRICIFGFSPIT